MYAIVEWILEGMFSIISLSAIVTPRKEFDQYSCGENVTAKFQGKTYPARINKISANKKELDEEMLKPVTKSQASSQEVQRSQQKKNSAKATKESSGSKRKSTGSTTQANPKKQRTETESITVINEEEVEDRISSFFSLSPMVNPREETIVDQGSSNMLSPLSTSTPKPSTPKKAKAPTPKVFKSRKYVVDSSGSESDQEALPLPLAAKCPRQTVEPTECSKEACKNLREELKLLKERLGSSEAECKRLKRTCQELNESRLQVDQSEHTPKNLGNVSKLRPGIISDRNLARENKMMELVRGTFVFLYEDQIKLATESAKSMSGLARLLTDVFFDLDVQRRSNLSGENGLQKLDSTIINAIITYCIGLDNFKRQSPAEIKQSLRNKLGCLRAPSRQKKN